MPLAKPYPHETKTAFLDRCYAHESTRKEFSNDNNQIGGYCYTAWKEHKKKASLIISVGEEEYAVFPPDAKKDPFPGDKRHLPSQDKINDDGGKDSKPVTPLGKDQGGPIPPQKKGGPVPNGGPTTPTPDSAPIKTTETPGDDPDNYDEVDVQAGKAGTPLGSVHPKDDDIKKREKTAGDPSKEGMPNPDKGGPASSPNPDNSTAPVRKDGISSFDDDSAKPDLDSMKWYMANDTYAYAIDPETGLAKWPLTFKKVERDFNRPNKGPHNPNTEPKVNQADPKKAVEIALKDRPYVI